MQWKLLAVIAICALISSFAGAACLSLIPQSVLRPFVFVMLIVIAIYTLVKRTWTGSYRAKNYHENVNFSWYR
ncbi:TSUP family transporter [Acinetobacter baumannii]